jgi:hypothetical protein
VWGLCVVLGMSFLDIMINSILQKVVIINSISHISMNDLTNSITPDFLDFHNPPIDVESEKHKMVSAILNYVLSIYAIVGIVMWIFPSYKNSKARYLSVAESEIIPKEFQEICMADLERPLSNLYESILELVNKDKNLRHIFVKYYLKRYSIRISVYNRIIFYYKINVPENEKPGFEIKAQDKIGELNVFYAATWIKYYDLILWCHNYNRTLNI